MFKNNNPNSPNDIKEIIKLKDFDKNIETYYHKLLQNQKDIFRCFSNQFYYINDLYNRKIVHVSDTIFKMLGYDRNISDFTFFYEIIHPADRLLIYKATIRSLNLPESYKGTDPFDYVVSMDYRIKKADGDYIRVLRQTGLTANDKKDNMLFTFALFTDISDVKKSNKISVSISSKSKGRIDFPDEDLLSGNNIFTPQETTIINYLSKGVSSKSIAKKLHISSHTVDTHRRNMLKKGKLKNTAELITYANEHGII